MIIAVVDGLGGGIGSQIVSELKEALSEDIEIWALGGKSGSHGEYDKSWGESGSLR